MLTHESHFGFYMTWRLTAQFIMVLALDSAAPFFFFLMFDPPPLFMLYITVHIFEYVHFDDIQYKLPLQQSGMLLVNTQSQC